MSIFRKKDADPAAAGEIRGEFGTALNKLLPKPELRQQFRVWRHTRPFWAGVLVMIAGAVIISYPLGPFPAMMAIGASAITGVVIGLILIIGGLFYWFAPHQRAFVSIILMLCSVLSYVATNLGGFFVGLILGMLGSAMGFGWKQPKAKAPTPTPRPGPTTKAGAMLAVGVLATSLLSYGSPGLAEAQQGNRPANRPPIPSIGCGDTNVHAKSLAGREMRLYTDTIKVRNGCGQRVEVVDLFIGTADLTDYSVKSPSDTLSINSDLTISDIELLTPHLCIKATNIVDLLSGYIPVGDKLPPIIGDILGPITSPITDAALRGDCPVSGQLEISPGSRLMQLLQTPLLRPLMSKDSRGSYFPIQSISSKPADFKQPYIRGNVELSPTPNNNVSIKVTGGPPAR